MYEAAYCYNWSRCIFCWSISGWEFFFFNSFNQVGIIDEAVICSMVCYRAAKWLKKNINIWPVDGTRSQLEDSSSCLKQYSSQLAALRHPCCASEFKFRTLHNGIQWFSVHSHYNLRQLFLLDLGNWTEYLFFSCHEIIAIKVGQLSEQNSHTQGLKRTGREKNQKPSIQNTCDRNPKGFACYFSHINPTYSCSCASILKGKHVLVCITYGHNLSGSFSLLAKKHPTTRTVQTRSCIQSESRLKHEKKHHNFGDIPGYNN